MSQIFREADPWHDPNRMHPSFRKKEYVVDQAVAANSRMDRQPGVQQATIYDPKPAPIASKYDTAYDPDHPQADWTGSYKVDERAHYSGHRSMQSGIIQEERGFISKDEQPMWACKRRGQTQGLASTPGLIGGIGSSDPREAYRSVARRQAELDSTNRDQYTLAKRNIASGGRKALSNPAQSRDQDSHSRGGRENRSNGGHVRFAEDDADDEEAYALYQASMQRQEEQAQAQGGGSTGSIYENLAGYRAPPQTKSLTAGLAGSLAGSLNMAAIPRYVQQKDRKDLDADKPIPGYTGYRRNNLNL